MRNIHVILIAYALDVTELVRSFHSWEVILHLFLHSARPDVVQSCQRVQAEFPGTIWYNYQSNRGLGKSCNDGILASLANKADAIIIPNDDVTLSRADFDRLVQGCIDYRDFGLIVCNGFNNGRMDIQEFLSFSVFGINPVALEQAGYFDENLPDYFCDCDYSRRCALLGVKRHHIGDTQIVHKGSATIYTVPELGERVHSTTFPSDQAYYERKHGGKNPDESFLRPFNDENLNWRIPAEERENPYPAWQRPESELAR